MKKEIKTKSELLKILKGIPIKDKEQRNSIVCSLIGHSRINTACFGYRNCGRCGDQLGDNLASVDYGRENIVFIGHKCKQCISAYKMCTWRDKLYVKDPFKV